jgi:hypothetical protein
MSIAKSIFAILMEFLANPRLLFPKLESTKPGCKQLKVTPESEKQ